MMSSACGWERSFESAAPSVPCTQWSGHKTCLPYLRSMVSNGFLPLWLEANETWPAVCQSCVITTLAKPLAILLITAMTWSPSFTARLPPGRKQFCTSMTSRAEVPSTLIGAAANSAFETRPVAATVPTPARIRLRSNMLNLPLEDSVSKSGRGGSVKTVANLARLNSIAYRAEARARLGPVVGGRTGDDSQRLIAVAEPQPLHDRDRCVRLAAGGLDTGFISRRAVY